MSERTYYVFCDDNCKFEAMTKEQVLEAIHEATGFVPQDIDAAFITKIKEQNKQDSLKFWKGTQAQYNALSTKDPNTIYIIGTNKIDFEDIATKEQVQLALEAEVQTRDMISDEWDSLKTYSVGDYCIHNNQLFKCLVQNQNVAPVEGATWTQVSITKEFTPQGAINITDNISITSSTGTLVSYKAYAYGAVVVLSFTTKKSTATPAGQNSYLGNISGTYKYGGKRYSVLPMTYTVGGDYQGANYTAVSISAGGALTVRALIGQISANSNNGGNVTYIATPLD